MSYFSKLKRQGFYRSPQRYILVASLYLFSFMIIIAGAGLCLIKSPQQQSKDYQQLAQYYQDQAEDQNISDAAFSYLLSQRHATLAQALALTPHNQDLQDSVVHSASKITFLKQGNAPDQVAQTMIKPSFITSP